MKSLKRYAALLFLACVVSTHAVAQDEVDELLKGSVADGEKLIGAYIAPLMNSLSSGLNQGWYNTAKPHKVAGFDLTVTVNTMSIPKDELFYNVDKLNLSTISLDDTSPDRPNAPTVFGPDREPIFHFEDENGIDQTFQGPAGLDMEKHIGRSIMPVPMAHFAFGLPKGTELKFRYVPALGLEDNIKFNLFGIGVLHDVKQWIPGIKTLPFDLSAFAGYTKMKLKAEFESSGNTQDARGVFEVNAATVQGIISKKVSVLTVYGGVGYNIAKSKLAMLGSYDINQDGDYADTREKDPINLDFSASGPRMTAGFRLKLAVLTLHGDYTLQRYKCLTVGIGINVR